jgi:hypothetical protein
MAEEKGRPAEAAPAEHEPAKDADAEPRKLTHEEFVQTLKDNPHFRVIPPSGTGSSSRSRRARPSRRSPWAAEGAPPMWRRLVG